MATEITKILFGDSIASLSDEKARYVRKKVYDTGLDFSQHLFVRERYSPSHIQNQASPPSRIRLADTSETRTVKLYISSQRFLQTDNNDFHIKKASAGKHSSSR